MSRELQLLNDVVTAGRALDKARAEMDAADEDFNQADDGGAFLLSDRAVAADQRLLAAETAEAAALQGLRDALAALDAHDAMALHLDARCA